MVIFSENFGYIILLIFGFCCCWEVCCLCNHISFIGNMPFLYGCIENILALVFYIFMIVNLRFGFTHLLNSWLDVASWILWSLPFNYYRIFLAFFCLWIFLFLILYYVPLKFLFYLILSPLSLFFNMFISLWCVLRIIPLFQHINFLFSHI